MCGIVAIQDPGLTSEDARAAVEQSLGSLRHRGPDDGGCVVTAGAGLGMRRLTMRSASVDSVPFAVGDGSHAALNGEVYAVTPAGTGAAPQPSRTVLGGADEVECVFEEGTASCEGMWGAIRLSPDGTMVATRDPFGIKPLWVRTTETGVGLASELPALEVAGPLPSIRRRAVAEFLLLGRFVDGQTIRNGIRALPPGTRTSWKAGEPIETRMWERPREGLADGGLSAARPTSAEIVEAIDESVRWCVDSERPLGVALSGGLDSTILAHHLLRQGVVELASVSVRVEGVDDGVRDLAELPVQGAMGGWRHRARTVDIGEFLPLLRRCVRIFGEPTSLTSTPLYLALSELAADAGIVALLVGEGADELWGGYSSYLDIARDADVVAHYAPAPIRDWVTDLLGSAELVDEVCTTCRDWLPGPRGSELVRQAERQMSLEPLLYRTDMLTMSQSIEARVPFLHGRAAELPDAFTLAELAGDGQTKRPLRTAYDEAFAGRTPPKTPFRAPWSRWLDEGLMDDVMQILESNLSALDELGVRPSVVREVAVAATAADPSARMLLFRLTTLCLWIEECG
ncbi:asparagine synthetase B family protein [Nocardioides bruguierae]|uniref:asparagine synthase (glutamine-hydrolyzing) n=1 Tax=Nocardioides bruguierae TaxID=2945102 RepID=A0A9X2DBM5_9ACTN|nr:asparagine synthetase B [Nocardioides bruguierae]MCM0622624.1 asparagine synthetase B [Nocardioides bruguierae]